MAGLGDGTWGGDWTRPLGIAGGIAALLAGLLVLTAGGARVVTTLLVDSGLPAGAARQIAIASVSTLPPVILGGLLVMTRPRGPGRLVGLAGVSVALTGIAVGLPLGFESAFPVVAIIYATGLFFVVATLVHALVAGDPRTAAGPSVGWSRDSGATYRSSGPDVMPADGGDEDDDLTFLLEDDEE